MEILDAIVFLLILAVPVVIIGFFVVYGKSIYRQLKLKKMPDSRRIILNSEVKYYINLTEKNKRLFESSVERFLKTCKFTGVDTTVTEKDRILVAASAIIPVFPFPEWEYSVLNEVIIYPDNFNEEFETTGPDRFFRGLVGFGFLEGKLLISRTALYEGFDDFSDARNTCIHEFVHLIDKEDGKVDGIPKALLDKSYFIPWMFIMNKEIRKIKDGKSDIHPYATKNAAEFFSVSCEYFFERPDELKLKHPELYRFMKNIFEQHPTA
jgi:Mlc titration factor MtfA (ptsG expression regulator)